MVNLIWRLIMPKGIYIRTQEQKETIRSLRCGKIPWNKGILHSKKTKSKISESKKGIKDSLQTRRKKSLARIGKNNPNYGKHHTDETKKRISENTNRQKQIKSLQDYYKLNPNVHALKNNPNWRGGKSFEEYPPEFNNELKARIRARDNNQCQLCGIFEDYKAHDVHHIDYDKENNDDLNLITLCKQHHSATNSNRIKWEFCFVILNEIRRIK